MAMKGSQYAIEHVLHPTDTDISPDGETSREFTITATSVIRLEGTIADEWDVQSKLAEPILNEDGLPIFVPEWVSETEEVFGFDSKIPATKRQIVIEGNPFMVYRIVLGSGHSGPNGLVYPIATKIYR